MEKDYENDCVIELNVGGKLMSTLRSTITKEADSLLANMIKGNAPVAQDSTGRYFLDCDPNIFGHVLEFLRFGLLPPHDKVIHVYEYAKHFGITKLVDVMEQFKTVQYKKKADEAKSKLDLEKYNTLKQNIVTKLAGLRKYKDKCICIVTRAHSANAIPACSSMRRQTIGHQRNGLNGGSFPIKADVLYHIETEISIIIDENLLTAIREDLFQLGYGKVRYWHYEGLCNGSYHQHLYILLSKRHEDNKIDSFLWENV
ncbi:BTB/POZ domain-containing protein KCTD7-like [Mercenaria mercenaria]|uniref:BTB/POZ domain-containing protein KCTD7-like n=1 Tax=Mercenaria mercenaria TaxID=6596 RepID=UPI00234E4E8C|nr:BTB/POZ domain-containing protein KCTD7-like [Mercenaria mercenaria]